MLPLGHAAVAYLAYVGVAAATTRRLPARTALLPLAIGSQLPDLIDKPLAYYHVLPSGRALGHSLLTLIALLAAAVVIRRRLLSRVSRPRLRRLIQVTPVPLGVGIGTHLIGDSYQALLTGQFHAASYLLYPVFPAPIYPSDDIPPWIRLLRIYQSPRSHDQLFLIIAAAVVFVSLRIYAHLKTSKTDPPVRAN